MIPVIYYFFFFFFWSTWIQTGIENYDVGTLPVVSIHWSQGVPANESEIFKSRQDWFFLGWCAYEKKIFLVLLFRKKKNKKKRADVKSRSGKRPNFQPAQQQWPFVFFFPT